MKVWFLKKYGDMKKFESFYNEYKNESELNEGFKETLINSLMALFSMGAAVYEGNYILNFLNKQPAPIEQKIEALNTIKNQTTNQKLKNAIADTVEKINQPTQKIKQDISGEKSKILNIALKFILPNEILGNDIDNKINDKIMTPYLDDAGYWTVGVGHLIGDEKNKNSWIQNRKKQGKPITLSRKEATEQFKQDLEKHYNLAQKKFQKQWYKFPDQLKVSLIDISFRGDLESPDRGDFNFVNLIKQGNYKKAASEYLDHAEYKTRNTKKTKDGVVKRMNRNASIISNVI
jgi:GH24 family phage-related lysozyme (muramidase)